MRVRISLLQLCLLTSSASSFGAVLKLNITPQVSGETIQPASLRYKTTAGERYSITRVSFLASDFALQRSDGSWLEFSNSAAWFDLEQPGRTLRLQDVPPGEYRSIRFSVGLNPGLNHAEPGSFPADHPLNPNLNGLHWSWQGGYIFLAVEGLWRNAAGSLDGWAYHLARDTNRVPITLAAEFGLVQEMRLDLDFDLGALLGIPRPLSFAGDGSSTHSRDGDPIANVLVGNLPGAFRLRGIRTSESGKVAETHVQPLFMPARFTPYLFKMSAAFPVPDLPKDNPLIVERVELGRTLFFDKRLSVNSSQSCADCHLPDHSLADSRPVSKGAEGTNGTRHAMPLVNLAWKSSFFWDGRAASLREQVLQPIQNPIEMHQPLTNLVAKLAGPGVRPSSGAATITASRAPDNSRGQAFTDVAAPGDPPSLRSYGGAGGRTPPQKSVALPDYPALFFAAFGSPEITPQKIALALENYLLTLTSFDSKFDRAMRGMESLTPEEQRGFELFSTEYDPRRGQFGADCFHCHGGPLFRSQSFANNGLDASPGDPGRATVSGKDSDLGKFAVPSLRNVALTSPYMHDGRFQTLDEVVEHYTSGVKRSGTLDPNLAKHPDGGIPLSTSDKRGLVAFLKALTDDSFP